MKPLITCLVCFALFECASAQNIGIGTNTPNTNALLHIASNNKGVLFPIVNLQSKTDNSTITGAPFGLMVMNNNIGMPNGRGLYYNAAYTGNIPSWEPVGGLHLPYQGTTSGDQYAFQVNNTTGTSSSVGILGYATGGKGIYGSSNTGTGVFATSNSGLALEVNGKIKISGLSQSPGLGKVLTSDANGNATWEGGVAFASYGIQPDGASEFTKNESKKVAFYTEKYDLGNNYNPSTVSPYSTFTAPVAGIYHFDVNVVWEDDFDASRSMQLVANYNGQETDIVQVRLKDDDDERVMHISQDVKLRAGEQVYVTAGYFTIVTTVSNNQFLVKYNSYFAQESYFIGRLVMRL